MRQGHGGNRKTADAGTVEPGYLLREFPVQCVPTLGQTDMNQFDISHLRQAQIDTIQREAARLRARAVHDSLVWLGTAISRFLNGVRLVASGQTLR